MYSCYYAYCEMDFMIMQIFTNLFICKLVVEVDLRYVRCGPKED